MLKKVDATNQIALYDYFIKIGSQIPFYFPVDYDLWYKCMFNDTTEEGLPLFDELETFLYYENGILEGFIQYGISSFVFTDNGKDFNNHYAIIRNMHYLKNNRNPEEIIELALKYFENRNIRKISAFFHYFGMSCYARHGKLHYSVFYIEELLKKYSFNKEHENVYFSKNFDKKTSYCDPKLQFEINENDNRFKINFLNDNVQICYCDFTILHSNIAYLYYIEVLKEYRHKGWGTKCMNIRLVRQLKKSMI